MPKNKEYTERGIREFYSVKGCHSCTECGHFRTGYDPISMATVCKCAKKIGKNSKIDRRFPYDNTKCEEFQEQSTER